MPKNKEVRVSCENRKSADGFGKQPLYKENPQSYKSKNPSWSFSRLDDDYRWGIKKIDVYNDLITKLKSFEGLTWQEIESSSGGKKAGHGSMNHFEPVTDLSKEAQKRWEQLKLYDYDEVFSIRLQNQERLYGILEDGVFRIVWYDPKHEIYPTKK